MADTINKRWFLVAMRAALGSSSKTRCASSRSSSLLKAESLPVSCWRMPMVANQLGPPFTSQAREEPTPPSTGVLVTNRIPTQSRLRRRSLHAC